MIEEKSPSIVNFDKTMRKYYDSWESLKDSILTKFDSSEIKQAK